MYTARPTPPALHAWVDAFWRFDATGGAHRVLPDGCIDFIFDLETGRGTVVGTMTKAALVDLPRGARLFGVRFRPAAAPMFVDARAHELVDGDVPLADLVAPAMSRLAERVAEAEDDAERSAIIGACLLDPRARRRAPDPRVRRAALRFEAREGAISVRAVAEELAVSERHLERLFCDHVGIRPKLFARIMRLKAAVGRPSSPSGLSQAELARWAGFTDEPHMLREFQALARATPKELRAERHVGFVQAVSTGEM